MNTADDSPLFPEHSGQWASERGVAIHLSIRADVPTNPHTTIRELRIEGGDSRPVRIVVGRFAEVPFLEAMDIWDRTNHWNESNHFKYRKWSHNES